MSLSAKTLAPILGHLAGCYPQEGCGVVLVGPEGERIVPLRNTADGSRAFAFADEEWLALLLEADRRSERVRVIFHSHPDQPAHLSAEDLRRTAPTGDPLVPGADLLVVSVRHGTPCAALLYRRLTKNWVPEPLPIGP